MKLSELEQQARISFEEMQEKRTQKMEASLGKQEKANEQFKQRVVAWMAQEFDLDADELTQVVTVDNLWGKGEVKLTIPQHAPVRFSLEEKGERFAVGLGRFMVERPLGDVGIVYSLGDALMQSVKYWDGRGKE